jgi:hypothetical protein
MDRRLLLSTGIAFLGASAAGAQSRYDDPPPPNRDYGGPPPPPHDDGGPQIEAPGGAPAYPIDNRQETYSAQELANAVSDFFGVTAETAGAIIERAFKDNGRPTGYIAGQEGSGAVGLGLRYGSGLLYMKNRANLKVFWQGPSIGWDFGGNASRVFTLCYNLQYPDMIYRRFPGIEGTAYFIGGLGINYQRAEDITLAPIRAGVGLRLGANLGYLAYSRRRHWFPG